MSFSVQSVENWFLLARMSPETRGTLIGLMLAGIMMVVAGLVILRKKKESPSRISWYSRLSGSFALPILDNPLDVDSTRDFCYAT